MAPQARAEFALERLPARGIDRLCAPAVFGHESGRVPRIERSDVVARMPTQRHRDAAGFALRQIIALADIVEAEQLDHHVMGSIAPGLDEGNAVMALVDVHEV